MMRFFIHIAVAWFLGLAVCAQPFRDDFDRGSMENWYVLGGEWEIKDGRLTQSAETWGRHIVITPIRLEQGSLRAKMCVDVPVSPSEGSFGFVLRFPGRDTYTALRLGAYGGAELMQPVKDARFRDFTPEVGRTYEVQVVIAGQTVTCSIDGASLGSADMAETNAPGTVGFYTECRATFDDFEVTGDWRIDQSIAPEETGRPELEMLFAEWMPTSMDPNLPVSVNGAVFAYFRNIGTGPAVIKSVTFAGREFTADQFPEWVGYMRRQPVSVLPGDVGRLEIRLSGLPRAMGMKLLADPFGSAPATLVMTPNRGEPVEVTVDLARRAVLQINFMAFSPDLRTVYVYAQNNQALRNSRAGPARIEHVLLNGTDVTERARLGSRQIARDVVPIEISLDQPLAKGKPVQVVIETGSGLRTGHVLRAFPSKFNILVYCDRNQARADFMEDIHNHCATALNAFFDREEFDRLGFDIIPMSGASYLPTALAHLRSPIRGIWADEVDKGTRTSAAALLRPMDDAGRFLPSESDSVPLLNFNLVSPGKSAISGHLMIPDAVMHSYGWYMCPNVKRGFGRVSTLPVREYRLSRRPFWPYFRDSEIAVPRDPEQQVMLDRHPEFQRCLTPKEQRWLAYGTLIQGAKSMGHWAYRSTPMSKFYFMWATPVMRMGLGAVAGDRIGPYAIPEEVVKMLRDVWREHGRINAELRVIGPLVAVSDVSYGANVVRVTPEQDRFGDPAAEAAALVSGLDTLVLLVLNHAIDPGESPGKSGPVSNPVPPKFDPVNVTVEVNVPAWLEPRRVFSVDYERVTDIATRPVDGRLRFEIPELEVSKVYVITASDEVRSECLARHAEMSRRLARAAAAVPAPNEAWADTNVK